MRERTHELKAGPDLPKWRWFTLRDLAAKLGGCLRDDRGIAMTEYLIIMSITRVLSIESLIG